MLVGKCSVRARLAEENGADDRDADRHTEDDGCLEADAARRSRRGQ